MKRFITLAVLAALVFGSIACSGGSSTDANTPANNAAAEGAERPAEGNKAEVANAVE